MLLILIKDLVKKGHSAVLKNLTSLVAQARPQAFSLFWGNLTARELRSNLVPRVLSYTQRRVWGNSGNEVGFARALAFGRWRIFGRRRIRVVPHFPSGIVSRATAPFSRGVIFTRVRVSVALLSPNGRWWTTRSLGRRFSPPLLLALLRSLNPRWFYFQTRTRRSRKRK